MAFGTMKAQKRFVWKGRGVWREYVMQNAGQRSRTGDLDGGA